MDDEFGILESWNPVSLESRIPTSECLYYCINECLVFQKKAPGVPEAFLNNIGNILIS
jgi:hypothetical protein